MFAKNLLTYLGSGEAVFAASKAQILKIEGIGEIWANSILHNDVVAKAEQQLEFIEKHEKTKSKLPVF